MIKIIIKLIIIIRTITTTTINNVYNKVKIKTSITIVKF